jgi:hypothetical protein
MRSHLLRLRSAVMSGALDQSAADHSATAGHEHSGVVQLTRYERLVIDCYLSQILRNGTGKPKLHVAKWLDELDRYPEVNRAGQH